MAIEIVDLPMKNGDFFHGFVSLPVVGGFNPSEKYAKVSWDDYSQYTESHQIPWFQTTNQL